MKTKPPKLEVRWVDNEADLQAIVAISRSHHGEDGLTEQDVYAFLEKTDHVPKVLKADGKVVAYLLYQLEKGLILIHDIAVATPRQGHGKRLISHLIQALPRFRRRLIAVRVPETNLTAQLFFKALGFRCCKIVKRRGQEPLYAMKFIK